MRVRRRTVRTLHQSWTLRTSQSLRSGLCRLKGQWQRDYESEEEDCSDSPYGLPRVSGQAYSSYKRPHWTPGKYIFFFSYRPIHCCISKLFSHPWKTIRKPYLQGHRGGCTWITTMSTITEPQRQIWPLIFPNCPNFYCRLSLQNAE